MQHLQPPRTIVYIGDSVTDCERNREDVRDLGNGYARIAAEALSSRHPEFAITCYNRGISGDRLESLTERWEDDCLRLKPDVISLLIGVNHTVHRFKRDRTTDTGTFEALYRRLLEKTVPVTDAKLILLEPFVLPVERSDTPEYVPMLSRYTEWREDLEPKQAVIRKLAAEFGALHVPLDARFARAAETRPPAYWIPDGVHPSAAGHALIAEAWLEAVQIS